MNPLQVHPKAKAELRAARDRYADTDPELARAFLDEYRDRVRFITRFPGGGYRIPKHTSAVVRRFLFKRFPYKLIVAVHGDAHVILAIAHDGQDADYWAARLT